MALDTARSTGQVSETTAEQSHKMKGPKMQPVTSLKKHSDIDIIDIRLEAVDIDLKAEISSSLAPQNGLKKLPTLLLYDENGLQIFEKVGRVFLVIRPGVLTATRSHIWRSTT